MVGLKPEHIPIVAALGYLLAYRPAKHFVAIERELRLVYPLPVRMARASLEAVALAAAAALGLSIAVTVLPRAAFSGLAGDLTILAVGYILANVITRHLLRIRPRTDPFDGSANRPRLFRSMVLDQLFRQAIWSKLERNAASLEELERAARDPARRAALLTEYVESAQRWGWIKLERRIARLHDGYYWHPPVVTLLVLGLLFEQLHVTIHDLHARSYAETAELVRRSAAVLFGAAFYPLTALTDVPHAREIIQAAPLVMVMLFTFANPLARYALTLLIVVYFGNSLSGLPEAIAQWNAHPTVRQWKQFVDVMDAPVLGAIAKAMAGVASNGMSDVALSLQRFWGSASPSAWVGVSIALWAPLVVKLVSHLWFSEIGNLYFARRVRRPLSCGAPAAARVPEGIVLGVVFEKTGWRPSPADEARLASGASLFIQAAGKPLIATVPAAAPDAATAQTDAPAARAA